MTLSRRSLLMASAAAPLLVSGEAARAADAPSFTPPAKGRPMLLSFNENPLGLSPAARKAAARVFAGRAYHFAAAYAIMAGMQRRQPP